MIKLFYIIPQSNETSKTARKQVIAPVVPLKGNKVRFKHIDYQVIEVTHKVLCSSTDIEVRLKRVK